jgi:hypothetical protein
MLTKEQLHTLRAFAKDTGPFRCTKGQATELAEALTEALSLLEIAEVLTKQDFGLGVAKRMKDSPEAQAAGCDDGPDGQPIYFCCAPKCPGRGYRASVISHPPGCGDGAEVAS